jgi:hypothetical protein
MIQKSIVPPKVDAVVLAAGQKNRENLHPLVKYICEALEGTLPPELAFVVFEYGVISLNIFGWMESSALGSHSAWVVPFYDHRFYQSDPKTGAVGFKQLSRSIRDSQTVHNDPSPVAMLNDSMVVVDVAKCCVYQFSLKGKMVSKSGGNGKDKGKFSNPLGVSASHDKKTFLVCDTGNKRIQRIGLDHKTKQVITAEGLYKPVSVCESTTRLYVVDEELSAVCIFDSKGTFLRRFGQDRLSKPTCVVCTDTRVFVADPARGAVLVFDLDGVYVGTTGTMHPGRSRKSSRPSMLALCGNYLAVSEKLSSEVQFLPVSFLSVL